MKWIAYIGALWVAAFTYSVALENVPGTYWYMPGMMVVEDTVSGVCPEMHYEREIKRPFHGEWLVNLRKQGSNGGWTPMPPLWEGKQDYRTDAVLPEPLTFGWWVWDENVQCNWNPGVYKITTEIRIHAGEIPRYVRVESNPFTVLDR